MISQAVGTSVRCLRELLRVGRERIRWQHRSGGSGSEVAAAVTDLIDQVLRRWLELALPDWPKGTAEQFNQHMALVAVGGYGRAELSPHSDLDLVFLYRPPVRQRASAIMGRLVRDLWDAGLVLGSSMRTVGECIEMARRDLTVHTALLESRQVAGAGSLTARLQGRLGRLSRWGRACRLAGQAAAERRVEQAQFGRDLHLLEPNVKRSRGGLRDLHLLRWVARWCRAATDWDQMLAASLISPEEAAALEQARQFLLRIRNDLHWHAGSPQDTLTFTDQLRLARFFGYRDRPGLLAVEQFMRQYYRHCSTVEELCGRVIGRCCPEPLWRRAGRAVFGRVVENRFRLYGGQLAPLPESEASVCRRPERLVHLFEVANRLGAEVAEPFRERAGQAAADLSGDDWSAARRCFLRILRRPGNLERTLRHLYAAGILELLLPELSHARGLIQFNQYHKYTVDEHSLQCVAQAERFERDPGPVGSAYRHLARRDILHLALLIHDLGKGYEEDHCERGRQIAEQTAQRFGLARRNRDTLTFLVHRHLLMSRLAFGRDPSDEQLVDRFARQVGTPEVLTMFFVFTAADMAAAGPDSWTSWKADVLADLYGRTMERLSGGRPRLHPEQVAAAVREQVSQALGGTVAPEWLQEHLAAMPGHYLLGTSPDRITEHLRQISQLPPGDVRTTASYDQRRQTAEYTVYTFDELTPGLFSKVCGVLAAKGMQILGAEITTYSDGVVVDSFEVIDTDCPGPLQDHRVAEVGRAIRQVLLGRQPVEPLVSRRRRLDPRYQTPPPVMQEPTGVQIDNDTSERFTILDVFATDRQGLLYIIARTIFELGLSVWLAKIATRRDQVLDVFYVTDLEGNKITDEQRLEAIGRRLVEAIDAYERAGAA